jgi:hypothetical protein
MITASFDNINLITVKELHCRTFWYLATVYSSYPEGKEAARKEALAYANMLIQAEVPTFSPVVHSHPIAEETANLPAFSHLIWMPQDLAILRGASGLLIAPMLGWRLSKGIGIEVEEAKRLGLPIYILDGHW